jgi:exonuclease I
MSSTYQESVVSSTKLAEINSLEHELAHYRRSNFIATLKLQRAVRNHERLTKSKAPSFRRKSQLKQIVDCGQSSTNSRRNINENGQEGHHVYYVPRFM